mgnify:CR=1 FL=1
MRDLDERTLVNKKGYILCQKKRKNIQWVSVCVEKPLNKKEYGKNFVQEIVDGKIGIK